MKPKLGMSDSLQLSFPPQRRWDLRILLSAQNSAATRSTAICRLPWQMHELVLIVRALSQFHMLPKCRYFRGRAAKLNSAIAPTPLNFGVPPSLPFLRSYQRIKASDAGGWRYSASLGNLCIL